MAVHYTFTLEASRVETFDKRTRKIGIERELFFPTSGDSSILTYAHSVLYSSALTRMGFTNNKDALVDFIARQGRFIEGSRFEISLREVVKVSKFYTKKPQEALMLAAGALFERKYNMAVKNLEHRSDQISKQGYLDFSSFSPFDD